jgi:ubiquitin
MGSGSSGDIQLVDCDIDDDDDADDGDVVPTGVARKLLFLVYGTSQKNIDDAVKAIDDLGKSSIADQVLDKAEHQAQIAKLNDVQVSYFLPFSCCDL